MLIFCCCFRSIWSPKSNSVMENNNLGLRFHKISRQPVALPKLDPLVAIVKSTNAPRRRAASPLFFRSLTRKKRVDESESLTLESIRNSLIRQEDSQVLAAYMVKGTEKLHAKLQEP